MLVYAHRLLQIAMPADREPHHPSGFARRQVGGEVVACPKLLIAFLVFPLT
jgi:hypothetical protein